MFKWIGSTFMSIKASVDSFLIANPIVKNLLDGVIKSALVAGVTFISSAIAPASATAITVSGILAAVGVGVKTYAQHQADTFVQTQLQALAPTAVPNKPS